MPAPFKMGLGEGNTTGKEGGREGGREGRRNVPLHLLHRVRQIALLQHVVIRQHPRVLQGVRCRQSLRWIHHQQLLNQIFGFRADVVPHGRMKLELPALDFPVL